MIMLPPMEWICTSCVQVLLLGIFDNLTLKNGLFMNPRSGDEGGGGNVKGEIWLQFLAS